MRTDREEPIPKTREDLPLQRFRNCADRDDDWAGLICRSSRVEDPGNNRVWRVTQKLEPDRLDSFGGTRIARGVFRCIQRNENKEVIRHGVMKAYLQYDNEPEELPEFIEDEINALRRIAASKKQCHIDSPGLYFAETSPQPWFTWVEGGFRAFIFMEYVPGIVLSTQLYSSFLPEERAKVRAGLKRTQQSLWQIGVGPMDVGIRNLIWDRESQRCSIIDFEAAAVTKTEEEPWGNVFDDCIEYYLWGLSE